MPIPPEERCKEQVSSPGMWSTHRCTHRAVNSGYCRQHCHVKRAALDEYRDRLWDVRFAMSAAQQLVLAYEQVLKHLEENFHQIGLAVASGHMIATTVYEQARAAAAKLESEKP